MKRGIICLFFGIVTLTCPSCRPHVKHDSGLQAKKVSEKSITLRANRKELPDGRPVLAIQVCREGGKCHNALRVVNKEEVFHFADPFSVISSIGQDTEEKKTWRAAMIGPAIVAVYSVATSKRILREVDEIEEMKHPILEHSGTQLEELDAEIRAEIEVAAKKFSEFREKNASKHHEQSGERGGNRGDLMQAIASAEEVLKLSKTQRKNFRSVMFGAIAGIPVSLLASFAVEVEMDKNLRNKKDVLLELFSQSTTVTLTKEELRSMLQILTKYLPAAVDSGVKQYLVET